MTRVLYLTLNNNCGSTNAPLAAWMETFHRRGVEVSIICREDRGPLYDFADKWGLPIYADAMAQPSKLHPWPFLRSLYAMQRIARRHKIDLVHCNEHTLYPLARWLGRVVHKPVVVSVHFPMNKGFVDWALAGSRQPARMIFVSRAVLEQTRRPLTGRVEESRCCVVRNGLDLTRHVPDHELGQRFRAEHSIGPSDPVIGVACLLQPRKQVDHLVRAAEQLKTPNLRVLIAGGPAKEHEPYVQTMLDDARRRLGSRLIVLGHMTDLRGFYNALDLFVNTSLQEACSISVLEAMACGVPVIGYPSKSVDEQVEPDAGEITEQDRVDLLAAALAQWLGDPDRRARAAAAARRRVEEDYDVNVLAEVVCREYETAIRGSERS